METRPSQQPPEPQMGLKALADSSTVLVISRLTQMIGIPIGLFLLAWMFNTIQTTQIAITQLTEQIKERTADRYTASDARHDFATQDVRLESLNRRVGVLEESFSWVRGNAVPSYNIRPQR